MKKVSIIIPTLNEEAFVEKCLSSVSGFSLPEGWEIIEVFVIDGGSSDATCQIVARVSLLNPKISLLHNKAKVQVAALNLGVLRSSGDYLLRLDCHAEYPSEYLANCIKVMGKTGAANVGGIIVTLPRGESYSASLVQALTTHRFGVGDSGFRLGDGGGKADTVPYGFFNRKVFHRIGFFDERLKRGEDYEINKRLAIAGECVWRESSIKACYYNQSSIYLFLKKQLCSEAPYNVYMWYLAPYSFAWRHCIAGLFVIGLVLGILLWQWMLPRTIYLFILGLYAVLSAFSAGQQAVKFKEWRHFVTLPFIFLSFHVLYGLGLIWGGISLALRVSPVLAMREPWKGANQFRAWPPPDRNSWNIKF